MACLFYDFRLNILISENSPRLLFTVAFIPQSYFHQLLQNIRGVYIGRQARRAEGII